MAVVLAQRHARSRRRSSSSSGRAPRRRRSDLPDAGSRASRTLRRDAITFGIQVEIHGQLGQELPVRRHARLPGRVDATGKSFPTETFLGRSYAVRARCRRLGHVGAASSGRPLWCRRQPAPGFRRCPTALSCSERSDARGSWIEPHDRPAGRPRGHGLVVGLAVLAGVLAADAMGLLTLLRSSDSASWRCWCCSSAAASPSSPSSPRWR